MVGEYLKIKEATKQGYKKAYEGDGVNLSGRMKWQRGNVQKDMCQTLVTKGSERGVVVADDEDLEEYDGFNLRNGEYADLGCGLRIRKLTPLECWRLMGFDDEDFYKAKAVPTSDTQLYKQAGNSIVVNVLEAIFYSLFKRKGE
jgi:DNA (cytosine-5)-methyltransferase 1